MFHPLRFRILLPLLCVVFFAAVAAAQPRRIPAAERTQELRAALELTDPQTDSVKVIYEAAETEMRAAFEGAQGDRSAMREAMSGIRERTDKRIELLLTEEQKGKYEAFKKERAVRRPFGTRPPR